MIKSSQHKLMIAQEISVPKPMQKETVRPIPMMQIINVSKQPMQKTIISNTPMMKMAIKPAKPRQKVSVSSKSMMI